MNMNDLLKNACSKHEGNNQAILDEVLAGLPHEPWDDIAVGDPRASDAAVRKDYRYKSKKWEFARHYAHHLQNSICCICNKPLDRFDLHHIDNGKSHYFDLKLTNLEAIHHLCHMNEHGNDIKNAIKNNMPKSPTSVKKKKKKHKNDIKNAIKNNMPKTGENQMIEAKKFRQVVRGSMEPVKECDVLKTAAIENAWKNVLNRGFIATTISILTNMGLIVPTAKGDHRVTKDFLDFLNRSDKDVEELFRSNKKASKPYGDLHMQIKKNQTMSFERIRHPCVQEYFASIGLDMNSLLKNSEQFREMKLKNYLKKKKELEPPDGDGTSGFCKSAPPPDGDGTSDYKSYLDRRVKKLLDEKAKSIVAKIA